MSLANLLPTIGVRGVTAGKGMSETGDVSRTRRHITEVVTEEAMRRESYKVFRHLCGVSREYPIDGPEAEKLRDSQISQATHQMLLGALLCVREYQPKHYSALATATLKYLRELIEKGSAEYEVKKPRGAREFWGWIGGPEIAVAHDEIVRRLKEAWSKQPRPDVLPDRDAAEQSFVFKARGNEKLRASNLLRYARTRDRIAAIRGASLEVMRTEISDSTARRWLKSLKTPARVSHKILANALKRTPRKIQDLIREGRAQNRVAPELDRRSE